MENKTEYNGQMTDPCSDEIVTQQSEPNTTFPANDFDVEIYRLTQDFNSLVDVKKIITTVPVKKPEKQWFVRVHPQWQLETAVLEDKEDRSTFLVAPSLWAELAHEITRKALFAAVNTQSVFFLWPVKLPGEDGRTDQWNESSLEAVHLAKKMWVRVRSNMTLGAYEVMTAGGRLREPEWPQDIGFNELVKIAFKGKIIKEWDHPVLKRLRGE